MKEREILSKISHKQLLHALYQTQLLFFNVAIILSFFLFDQFTEWFSLFSFNLKEILYYGVIPAFIIVGFNIVLKFIIPEKHLDDGGLNKKLFENSSVAQIFIIALVVAICEEVLFRGLFQTNFGLIAASTIFAVVHVRYLKKPILLISIILISFYLGYLYLITGNLVVTIVAHFLVDFILGLLIRKSK